VCTDLIAEEYGLIRFLHPPTPSEILEARRTALLYGRKLELDHFVVTLPDAGLFWNFNRDLADLGATVIEAAGVWPTEFCTEAVPDDLRMLFASFRLPAGNSVVLAAPHAPRDQIDRFLEAYGVGSIHHVAVEVTNIREAVHQWISAGFKALPGPQDDGALAQWFLRSRYGQLVELVERKNATAATFSCANMTALRKAERIS
jgi:hypothetical protein